MYKKILYYFYSYFEIRKIDEPGDIYSIIDGKRDRVNIGYDFRKGIVGRFYRNISFDFDARDENIAINKLLFSIGVVANSNVEYFSGKSILIKVSVLSTSEEFNYSYQLPINGPYNNDWESGLCCYLTKYWADNIVEFQNQIIISKVNFHFSIYDEKNRKISLKQLYSIKPILTYPIELI